MIHWRNLVDSLTSWVLNQGLSLVFLILIAFLIPRAGRYIFRFLTRSLGHTSAEDKTRRALISTLIYLSQIVAYVLTFLSILKALGFSLTGVTIPAAFVSAAAALGAQSVVADFLAGFFILSEKQFGLGDWVHFQGASVDVQGEVIKMTMRATTVRTSSGQTVIVPNSAAKLSINHSNFWARAVVNQPIPITGNSLEESVARATRAARRAIRRPEVKKDIQGEMDVLPAVDFSQSTSASDSWLVTVRFTVQVTPARQWAVERAIRSSIIDEFWKEYRTHQAEEEQETQEEETTILPKKPRLQKIDVDYNAASEETQSLPAQQKEEPIEDEDPASRFDKHDLRYTSFWGKTLSLGNRIRPTSTLLLISTLSIFLIRLMIHDEDSTTTVQTNTTTEEITSSYVQPTEEYIPPSTTQPQPTPPQTTTPQTTTNQTLTDTTEETPLESEPITPSTDNTVEETPAAPVDPLTQLGNLLNPVVTTANTPAP